MNERGRGRERERERSSVVPRLSSSSTLREKAVRKSLGTRLREKREERRKG